MCTKYHLQGVFSINIYNAMAKQYIVKTDSEKSQLWGHRHTVASDKDTIILWLYDRNFKWLPNYIIISHLNQVTFILKWILPEETFICWSCK